MFASSCPAVTSKICCRSFSAATLTVVPMLRVMLLPALSVATGIVVAGIFLLLAVFGFKRSLWVVVVGSIGHGLFDFVHHFVIDNPGVPRWWPGFCLAFDVLFGVLLAWLLLRHPRLPDAKAPQTPLV